MVARAINIAGQVFGSIFLLKSGFLGQVRRARRSNVGQIVVPPESTSVGGAGFDGEEMYKCIKIFASLKSLRLQVKRSTMFYKVVE